MSSIIQKGGEKKIQTPPKHKPYEAGRYWIE